MTTATIKAAIKPQVIKAKIYGGYSYKHNDGTDLIVNQSLVNGVMLSDALNTLSARVDVKADELVGGGYGGGKYYLPTGHYIPNTGNASTVAGMVYYMPIFIRKTTVFNRIGAYPLSPGAISLGIYNFDNGAPTTKIFSGIASSSDPEPTEITMQATLARGIYALAFLTDTSGSAYRSVVERAATAELFGASVITNSTPSYLTETAAALPDVASVFLSSGDAVSVTRIWLRAVPE